ncbi:hypothetical protein LCGC14_2988910 [marine sediment metagenome]|uniref:Uncharacterized protein n=1 Tax=marine sediment metagenome TaxID=412755 RepID=A0A0F8X590_9ZZZZ
MEEEYEIRHAFLNQHRQFVLGFEAGQFYDQCSVFATQPTIAGEESDEILLESVYHTSNEGELLQIADHYGLVRAYWKPFSDDSNWATGGFKRR